MILKALVIFIVLVATIVVGIFLLRPSLLSSYLNKSTTPPTKTTKASSISKPSTTSSSTTTTFTTTYTPLYTITPRPFPTSSMTIWLDATSAGNWSGGTWINTAPSKFSNATTLYGSWNGSNRVASAINGLPGIAFSKGNSLYTSDPAGTYSNGATMFVVFQPTGNDTYRGLISRCSSDTNRAAPFLAYSGRRVIGDGTTTTDLECQNNLNFLSNGTPYIFTFRIGISGSTTATISEWLNGSIQYSEMILTNYTDTSSKVVLGTRETDQLFSLTGYMGEVIVYNRAITDIELGDIHSYLSSKWGISITTSYTSMVSAQYISFERADNQLLYVNLADIQVFDTSGNLLAITDGSLSSLYNDDNAYTVSNVYDRKGSTLCITKAATNAYIKVNLDSAQSIGKVVVFNRQDAHTLTWTIGCVLKLYNASNSLVFITPQILTPDMAYEFTFPSPTPAPSLSITMPYIGYATIWLDASSGYSWIGDVWRNVSEQSYYTSGANATTAYNGGWTASSCVSGAINKMRAIQFSGSNSMTIPTSANTYSSGATIFVVFRPTGTNTLRSLLSSCISTGFPSPFDMWDTRRIIGGSTSTSYSGTHSPTNLSTLSINTSHIYAYRIRASTSTAEISEWVNGDPQFYDLKLTGYGASSATPVCIGGRYDNYSGMGLTGYIGEIVVLKNVFTDTEVKNFTTYLSSKWGISKTTLTGISARYVRLERIDGQTDWFNLNEIQVFDVNGSYVAPTASEAKSALSAGPVSNLYDKITSTGYHSSTSLSNEYVQLDLGSNVSIGKVVIYNRPDSGQWRIFGSVVKLFTSGNTAVPVHTSNQINSLDYVYAFTFPFMTASPSPKTTISIPLTTNQLIWLDASSSSLWNYDSSNNFYWNNWSFYGYVDSSIAKRYTGTFSYGSWLGSGINNRGAIQFSGSNSLYTTDAVGKYASGLTMFVVFTPTGTDTLRTLLSRTMDSTGNAVPAPFDLYTYWRLIGNGTSFRYFFSPVDLNSLTNNTAYIFAYRIKVSGTTAYVSEWLNGDIQYSGLSLSNYGDTATSQVQIGTRKAGRTTFTGNIGEVIVYNTDLTDATNENLYISRINTYLSEKWGITLKSYSSTVTGMYIRIERTDNQTEAVNLSEIQAIDASGNKIATSSTASNSTYTLNGVSYPPSNVGDGNPNTFAHTNAANDARIQIVLSSDKTIGKVVVMNRMDCCQSRAEGCSLMIFTSDWAHVEYLSPKIKTTSYGYGFTFETQNTISMTYRGSTGSEVIQVVADRAYLTNNSNNRSETVSATTKTQVYRFGYTPTYFAINFTNGGSGNSILITELKYNNFDLLQSYVSAASTIQAQVRTGSLTSTDTYLFYPSVQQMYMWFKFNQGDLYETTIMKNYGVLGNGKVDTTGASISTTVYKVGNGSLYLSASYMTIPEATITPYGLTISSWFNYATATTGSWIRLFEMGNEPHSDNFGYSPHDGLFLYQGTTNRYPSGLIANGYADNNWHHIAITMTYAASGSATSTIVIYIDGTVVYSTTAGYYPVLTPRTQNYIGKSNWTTNANATGYVDDFRMYNYAMSAGEVTTIYQST